MRKGRTHRRTNRVSRPSLLGSNAHVESGAPSTSPRDVVIGVSPSTPPAPAVDPVEDTESVNTAAATAEVLPTPEPSTPASVEVVAKEKEADEPPPASEKRIATVRPARFGEDTLIDARPPEMDAHDEEDVAEEKEKPLLAAGFDPNAPVSKSTLIMGSSLAANEEREMPKLALSDKASEPPPKAETKEDAPLASFKDEPVEKSTKPGIGDKKEDLSKAMIGRSLTKEEKVFIEPTPTPSGMALPIEDEISVPPIVGEPTLERFFSEGDVSRHDEVIEEVVPEKLKRKTAPHVVQRRARFARYVTWAVGVSAVVCLAAVARTAFSPKVIAPKAVGGLVVTRDPALDAMNKAAPLPTWKTDEAKLAVAEPPKVEAKEATPAAAPTPTTDEAKPAETAAPAPVEGDAKAEKKACKQNLERGKIKDAIEAGEKSVAIDPTDGEAWLLLGASYQEMGKLAEARRCYTACIKEGKTGPRNECAKMLR